MPKRKLATEREPEVAMTDPDDAPPLDDAWFERAHLYEGAKLVRRGRPPAHPPKKLVSLRLSEDVVAAFKAGGPGWQTRIDETLRAAREIAGHWAIQTSAGGPVEIPLEDLVRAALGPRALPEKPEK